MIRLNPQVQPNMKSGVCISRHWGLHISHVPLDLLQNLDRNCERSASYWRRRRGWCVVSYRCPKGDSLTLKKLRLRIQHRVARLPTGPGQFADPPIPDQRRALVSTVVYLRLNPFRSTDSVDLRRTDAPSRLQFSNLTFENWIGTSLSNESGS